MKDPMKKYRGVNLVTILDLTPSDRAKVEIYNTGHRTTHWRWADTKIDPNLSKRK